MDSFALVQSSRFITTDRWSWRITALAFPMRISNSLFCLPSLVNETPRYLNFSEVLYRDKKMLYRDQSSFRVDSFCENLEAKLINVFSQQPVLNNNFNEMFELFSTTVLSTINAHAPLKSLSRKQKKLLSKP